LKLSKSPIPIGIVDYGCGNLHSVRSAFKFLGVETELIECPGDIKRSESIVLPGVGSFQYAMNELHQKDLVDSLVESVKIDNKKILGICLGFQLMARSSTESGYSRGLNLIDATVERFKFDQSEKFKIPHVGFNEVEFPENNIFFEGIKNKSDFYFCHSYRMKNVTNKGFFAESFYGENFICAYHNQNIFGAQFHPEKSQTNGLRILLNFLKAPVSG
jgi:glutamine amidotransferase